MKIVDKIALAIFSVFMLIISVVYILVYFGIMEFSLLNQGLNFIFTEEPTKTVLLVIAIISVILSIKTILFEGQSKDSSKDAIQINGADGVLEIMPTTIEHIALISLSSYASISDINAKMRTKPEGIVIDVHFTVLPDTNITELVEKIQKTIKDKIEQQTSAKVLEVNIKVKDIAKSKAKEE